MAIIKSADGIEIRLGVKPTLAEETAGENIVSKAELDIQMMIAEYLTLRYPGVIFRSDLGGIRLNMGQAMQVKRLQGSNGRGFPDFMVCAARHGYHGLFGEIKTSADEVYKKAGGIRQDTHTQEQYRVLCRLCDAGYLAGFWFGFDEARRIIDVYLGGPNGQTKTNDR